MIWSQKFPRHIPEIAVVTRTGDRPGSGLRGLGLSRLSDCTLDLLEQLRSEVFRNFYAVLPNDPAGT